MKRTVYEDAHVSITVDDAGFVRYVRTQEPYASLDALRAVHEKVKTALSTLPSGKLALLVDIPRQGRATTTPSRRRSCGRSRRSQAGSLRMPCW